MCYTEDMRDDILDKLVDIRVRIRLLDHEREKLISEEMELRKSHNGCVGMREDATPYSVENVGTNHNIPTFQNINTDEDNEPTRIGGTIKRDSGIRKQMLANSRNNRELVELMKQSNVDTINNRWLASKLGLTYDAAAQRIRRAVEADILEREDHNKYRLKTL